MNPLRLAIELRKVAESWVDKYNTDNDARVVIDETVSLGTKPWFRIDGGYKHGLLTVIVTSGE